MSDSSIQEGRALSNLRVALLNPDLWVGGSTVFSLNLGREFLRRGIAVEVFATGVTHSLEEDFRRCQLPVSRVPGEGLIFEDRITVILEAMRRFAPTVVIANIGFDTGELLRYLPAGVARVGIVHTVHPGVFQSADRYAPFIDRLVGVSGAFEAQLKASVTGFSAGQISSIEMGVPVPESSEARERSHGEPLRILYLGRLEEGAKRVRLFPKIFQDLRAANIPFRWTIAGIGPEQSFLQSRMQSRPGQEIRFTGLVPHSEIPALLDDHDIMLLTSDTETFSLSLHEGMAVGLVPVASALPGRVGQIVTTETGCPVPPDEVDGYARAIVWLHNHRGEMEEMSRASRRMISEVFSVASMTDRWVSFLNPLLAATKPVWPDTFHIGRPLGFPAYRYYKLLRPIRRWIGRTRATMKAPPEKI